MHRSRLRSLIAALLALLLVLTACGDGDIDDTADAEEEQPLALDLDEVPEDDASDEQDDAADAEDDAAAFDLVAAVTEYATTIPDGWMFLRTVEELEEALEVEGTVLIDVREPDELDELGVIPGAINLSLRELAQNLAFIPQDRPVFVYCATGWRAGLATSSLRMIGYDNVLGFSPGAPGWEAAGNELSDEVADLEDFGPPSGLEPGMIDAIDGFLMTLPEGWLTFQGADNALEAQELGAVMIDIRQPENYEEGHVPAALTIPIRELATTDVEIPMGSDVIVYCQTGWRTSLSMPILHLLGFDNVRGFPGSFDMFAELGAVTA